MSLPFAVDPRDLSQTGWAALFPRNEAPTLRKALEPLLDRRRFQAGKRYREIDYGGGRPEDMLFAQLGVVPGFLDLDRIPYYILLVGGPERLPYELELALSSQYAVGRIAFETVEQYAHYAASLLETESRGIHRTKAASFFSLRKDEATGTSDELLVKPLASALEREGYPIDYHCGPGATKRYLVDFFEDRGEPSAVLFAATHGLSLGNGEVRELNQGALLCADWPGAGAPESSHIFGAADVGPKANLKGLVAFLFSSFAAGFHAEHKLSCPSGVLTRSAGASFVSPLARRLLGHPGGGALAALGPIARCFDVSYRWPVEGAGVGTYVEVLRRILSGFPVGFAFRPLADRANQLAQLLCSWGQSGGREFGPHQAHLMTAYHEAKSWVIVGDPAAGLSPQAG